LPFKEAALYKCVRHPMMLGFLIAFWSTPDMSEGHLLFAAATTAYIMVGVRLEERDLDLALGDDYRSYRRRVGMLLPRMRK
jgi:methanethiol S-methyltransferase